MRRPTCAAIIVTHNSQRCIVKTMESLQRQSHKPDQIVIVDSGSNDPAYLSPFEAFPNTTVIYEKENVGFCKGNNIGVNRAAECTYTLFLNPDAFLKPSFVKEAIALMETDRHCGALTGILMGYDMQADAPTNRYDSTGIFCTWYGKWYDRDQGKEYRPSDYLVPEHLPAICGALLFCRKKALDSVLLKGDELFDNSFYMYKEDIDLSCRLRRAGWKLVLYPQLSAYHCRGWQKRSQISRTLRLQSAKNEMRLSMRNKNPLHSLYSMIKYLSVYWLDL